MPAHRAILHVDMDAFFAAIEQLDRPELRGRPVLVGGDGPRGVVAACSYESRPSGCRSAQPMAVAKRLCPDAVVVTPRPGRYREVSARLFAILESFTPLVEPLSIDEAFLDVTGSQALLGPAREIAVAIKRRIAGDLGLTASVGVAGNKFLAKLASDLDKPDGLTVIEPDRVEQLLADLPVARMWGVGPVMERTLAAEGIRTFGDLRGSTPAVLKRLFGASSARMAALAAGRDDREVVPDGRAKSISQEQTFDFDVEEPGAVREVLLDQVSQVGRRLRKHGLRAGRVTVKIRYGDFQTITRSRSLREPVSVTDSLWEAGSALFDRWVATSFSPVRLIGFGAAALTYDGEQLALFPRPDRDRSKALDDVTDAIQDRFGAAAIHRGGAVPRPDRLSGRESR